LVEIVFAKEIVTTIFETYYVKKLGPQHREKKICQPDLKTKTDKYTPNEIGLCEKLRHKTQLESQPKI
jgi:hypothetical protein